MEGWTLISEHRGGYEGNYMAVISDCVYECDVCNGDGDDPDDDKKPCPQCKGKGKITVLE